MSNTAGRTDFYRIEQLLSPEERDVRDVATRFVDREVLPIIREHFEKGIFPAPLIPKLAEAGFLGANIKGYDCPGINNVAYGLMLQELERGDSGMRSFVSVQSALVMFPILEYGSEEQKNRWLPKLAKGQAVGCFGLTESDHGSDPASMTTKAVRKADRYVLDGSKMWITNGSIADIAVVWAKLDGEIRGFLVEKGTPGFSAQDIGHKFSLRASVTSELSFNHCEIPQANILPKTKSLICALRCLNQARYGIAWGAIGAATACYEEALNHAKNRIMFGKPIGAFQLVQEKLANMVTEITKAQLLALQVGRLKDKGEATHAQISMAKRNNVKIALGIARQARDILGASGISLEYSCLRHMLNLESVITYEGTDSIHTLIIGKEVTGIDAMS